jgi:hypothetical protein
MLHHRAAPEQGMTEKMRKKERGYLRVQPHVCDDILTKMLRVQVLGFRLMILFPERPAPASMLSEPAVEQIQSMHASRVDL